jgi:hypothetical protein
MKAAAAAVAVEAVEEAVGPAVEEPRRPRNRSGARRSPDRR